MKVKIDRMISFLSLCQHVVIVHGNLLDVSQRKRGNLLSTMSFCFIGGMTFLSSAFDSVSSDYVAASFAIAFIGIWLVAFAIAMAINSKDIYYRVIPGRGDGISFLPCRKDRVAFRESKVAPYDADEFFMRRYLDEAEHGDIDGGDYFSLLHEYQDAIRELPDIENVNRNAWLASLVHISIAQTEIIKKHLNAFRWLYLALWLSMACLVVSFILCLF